MKQFLSLLAVGALAQSSALIAQKPQDGGRGKGQMGDPWSRISAYDKDEDGKVTAEEFDGPAMMMARFDTDKDGVITKEEVAAMRGKQRGGRGGSKEDSAPQVGDPAPKVSAVHRGTEDMVDLSSPKRHTVIVFGSHT